MNQRGQYGAPRSMAPSRAYVGAVIHTPGETETELDTLHGEIMQFGQEADAWVASLGTDDASARLAAAQRSAWDELRAFEQTSKVSKANPLLRSDGWIPQWEKLHKKYADLTEQRANYVAQHPQEPAWYRTTWKPFFDEWEHFYEGKKNTPLQLWPGSGTWDYVQDYRQKLIDIRKAAPFKPQGPEPLDPDKRRDQDLTGGIGDLLKNLGSFAKYGAIAGLGIVGIVALSSVAQNLRSGKDPAANYMELIRSSRRSSPRTRATRAPRAYAPTQAALPAGELEDL